MGVASLRVLSRSFKLAACVAAVWIAAVSCSESPTGPGSVRLQELIDQFGLTPLPELTYPQYNPYVPARILLGQLLFFDPILGGESAPWVKRAAGYDPYRYRASDMACASCHHPQFAFADGRALSAGVGTAGDGTALGPARQDDGRSVVSGQPILQEPRNAPTVLNTAFNGKDSPEPTSESFQFLDGRVSLGLEVQAQEPITDRVEMAGDAYGRDVLGDALTADDIRDSLTVRIRQIPGYVTLFRDAYPDEINTAEDIQITHVTKALAAYQRELITPGSRYDRFVSGDFNALNVTEQRGFELFFTKALCGDCHHGPMLSDFQFHVQGAADAYPPGFPGKDDTGKDFGRFHADPEEFAGERYAFRTLTLRMIDRTAPYFHSGSAATLQDVVAFYNRGGQGSTDVTDEELAAAGAVRHPSIQPLALTDDEASALVAFLRTLGAPVAPGPGDADLTLPPQRVPSGLLPPGVPTPPGPGPFLP